MIEKIKAKERYLANHGWLKSYHLFSFADYYDSKNMEFGSLRVFNEDFILENSGFPMHPHNNMEIVTIILSGELSHEDSMSHKESIKKGQIQRFSAGTGIIHSEFNHTNEEVHLYQLWFKPIKIDVKPSYETITYDNEKSLTLLVDKNKLNSNADLYMGNLKKGEKISIEAPKIFIYLTNGSVNIDKIQLEKNDQARIENKNIEIKANSNSEFILIKFH